MSEIMHLILESEAAKGAFITLNFFGTELSKDDQETLYPTGASSILRGGTCLLKYKTDQMRTVADRYGVLYKPLFETVGDGSGGKTLEDVFYECEIQMNVLVFNM